MKPKFNYRPDAPAGVRMRAIAPNEKKDKWNWNDQSRTLLRDHRGHFLKKGGNHDVGRTLRRLPASISDRPVD
jgi:hypothetical protein